MTSAACLHSAAACSSRRHVACGFSAVSALRHGRAAPQVGVAAASSHLPSLRRRTMQREDPSGSTSSSTCRRFFSSSCTSGVVVTEVLADKAVGICTLNRPKALNALNDELVGTLISKLQAFDEDDTVRAIVVTGHSPSPEAGTEKAFAAGADIKQMNEKSYAEVNKSDMLGFWNDIKKIRKPMIAAVNGFALGGGCVWWDQVELAMACDIIVASEDAKFGQPEIKLGTIPGCGGTQRLTQAVGKSRAMWWVLSGEMISADEALRSGLVAKVFPKAELLPNALEMASKIAEFSSPVLNMAKDCVNQSTNLPLDQGLLFERRVFHATWGLADRKEGMTAFAEKRAPVFKNE